PPQRPRGTGMITPLRHASMHGLIMASRTLRQPGARSPGSIACYPGPIRRIRSELQRILGSDESFMNMLQNRTIGRAARASASLVAAALFAMLTVHSAATPASAQD